MNDALRNYGRYVETNSEAWKSKLEKNQVEFYKSRKEERNREKKLLESAAQYDIVCAGCFAIITAAANVKKIKETKHHLVTENIEDKIYRQEYEPGTQTSYGPTEEYLCRY
jgi:hypothetical protein